MIILFQIKPSAINTECLTWKKIGKFFTPNSNVIVTFEQSIIKIEEV